MDSQGGGNVCFCPVLRHVERSEVQDTAAAHAYVVADLLCHLLDLFMNIR